MVNSGCSDFPSIGQDQTLGIEREEGIDEVFSDSGHSRGPIAVRNGSPHSSSSFVAICNPA